MSGFVSVLGRRGAGIVARYSRGVVWAWRALPGGPGWHQAPACLFFPFPCGPTAGRFAQRVAVSLGWRVWVRRGSAGSPVWSACGVMVPPFQVKVALPAGLPAKAARAALAALQPSGLQVLV